MPQLFVQIGGRVHRTLEWSFGGFVIEDDLGTLNTGALVMIDGVIDEERYRAAQPPEPVEIRARVVRIMPDDNLAAVTCLKLDDRAYRVLQDVRDGIAPALVSGVV